MSTEKFVIKVYHINPRHNPRLKPHSASLSIITLNIPAKNAIMPVLVPEQTTDSDLAAQRR